jgi:hypothetical protein
MAHTDTLNQEDPVSEQMIRRQGAEPATTRYHTDTDDVAAAEIRDDP